MLKETPKASGQYTNELCGCLKFSCSLSHKETIFYYCIQKIAANQNKWIDFCV